MSPVQADFGLRAVNGNLMFNVDMMLGGRRSRHVLHRRQGRRQVRLLKLR